MTKGNSVPPTFVQLFQRVVRCTQLTGRLEPETLRDYYAVLHAFPIETVTAAADALIQRQKFFPSTAEWCEAIRELQAAARRALADQPPPTTITCEHCQDTGSVYAECPGDGTCGRSRTHFPHGFVCVCACRAMNRNYQRSRAAQIVRAGEDA